MLTFFCDPHSLWQRGSIENANGILRRDLPRKTEFSDYSEQDIQDLVWANNTTSSMPMDHSVEAAVEVGHLGHDRSGEREEL